MRRRNQGVPEGGKGAEKGWDTGGQNTFFSGGLEQGSYLCGVVEQLSDVRQQSDP